MGQAQVERGVTGSGALSRSVRRFEDYAHREKPEQPESPMPAIASHPMQLVLILAVVLLFFGAARLPALAKSLGQSARTFRTEMREPDADTPTPAVSTAPDPVSPGASTQRDTGA